MSKRQAFTLIELLVVIAIIGILSGLIVVAMSGVTNKANIAKSQVFSNSLRNSLMLNLISEWKLDENTGVSIADSWSGGNTGNLTNFNFNTTDGWRLEADCISGSCLQFDGSNDYIILNESESLKTDDITVELWINPSIVTNGSPIRTTATNKFYMAFHPDGNFTWHIRKSDNTGSYIYSNTVVSTNKWHHIVGTFKASTFQRLYLDGLKVADLSSIAWTPLVVAGNYTWTIGGNDWSASSAYYKGFIDSVRFYNAAASISQIQEQYYLGLNKLLTNGGITAKEYKERLASLDSFSAYSK